MRNYLGLVVCFLIGFLLASCGKSKTGALLVNKRWEVVDVKPISKTFNIEDDQRAKDLKSGFYKRAWFKFLEDSLFVGSFSGKEDTGRYLIQRGGKDIALFPRHGGKAYERMEILHLSEKELRFKTGISEFNMILYLKTRQ